MLYNWVWAMLGIRRGIQLEISPKEKESDQSYVLNAKSFHFHTWESGLLILLVIPW